MPIWQPAAGEDAGICLVSNERAVKKGLNCRSLEATVKDTLAWQKGRPEDKQKLKAGLTPEMEATLLAKLRT
jgi:2'-hydroxyisoflavone reductase